jgi:hypothetical protein
LIIPRHVLVNEYSVVGLSDPEIAEKYRISASWVSKLRKIYGISSGNGYLRRNPLRLRPLSDQQKEFLYGSLLGDSCIAVQRSGTGYWLCMHSQKQNDYMNHKVSIMSPFVAQVSKGSRAFKRGGPKFPYVRARSYALPQLTAFRAELYPAGVKTVSAMWLSRLTPAGFAYWYLDDGSTTGSGFDITTFDNYFRSEESKAVLERAMGISVSITWAGPEGNIHVLKESHEKVWAWISPVMTPDMAHKTPRRFR